MKSKIANIQSSIDRTNAEIEMMEDRLQEREDGAEEEAKQIAAIVTMQEKKRSQIESLSAEEQEKEARNDEIDKELLALSEELKEVIEALIAQVDENTGSEFSGERRDKAENAFRSKAEELEGIRNTRISFLSGLKDDSLVSRDITKHDFSKVLGGVDELIKLFDEYIASIPPVVDLILSSEGLIGKKRSIEQREREARAESLKNKMRLAEIRKTIETLRTDIDSLGTALDQQRDHYRETLSTIEQQKASIQSMKNSIEEKEAEKEDVISSSERDRNAVQDFLDRIKAKEAEREVLICADCAYPQSFGLCLHIEAEKAYGEVLDRAEVGFPVPCLEYCVCAVKQSEECILLGRSRKMDDEILVGVWVVGAHRHVA